MSGGELVRDEALLLVQCALDYLEAIEGGTKAPDADDARVALKEQIMRVAEVCYA